MAAVPELLSLFLVPSTAVVLLNHGEPLESIASCASCSTQHRFSTSTTRCPLFSSVELAVERKLEPAVGPMVIPG
jgi:hypothetical protein